MKILWEWIQRGYLRVIEPIADFFVRKRVNPNTITTVGTLCSATAGVIFATGHIKTAGWVLGLTALFDVLDGTVAVTQNGDHLRDLGRGDFFGELALLGHVPRTASVTCTTDGEFLVLGRREFSQLLADYPSIQGAVLQALATRIAGLAPADTH